MTFLLPHRRWLITFAATLLLWSVVRQINHYLAPHGAYLFVGGLLVTFAALRLSLRSGLTATLLIGLAIDAVEPVPVVGAHPLPGTHLVLFAIMHVVIFHLRRRFPREETIFGVVVALLANLGLFLGLSFVFVELGRHPVPGTAWMRLFVDLLWSQLFTAAVAPWAFTLQERALELGRVDLAEEGRTTF
jgi:rod shape-determining protein MreD